MLAPYRVLDLTDERGLLAGKMLATLGADVLQVEPPSGSTARRAGPFLDDPPGPDSSAYWAAYAAGKRGITCDLDHPEGQDLLRRLAASADFLIESCPPGATAARGLAYADLAALNPALIYVSITPFGDGGPKAGYADSDLVLWAAGGPMIGGRDGERPPLRVSVPQSYLHASGDAAGGALVAHFARLKSGRGQHVAISVQASVAQATLANILAAAVGHSAPPAGATNAAAAKWEAKDGMVQLAVSGGVTTGHFTNNLFRWLHAEGACDAATAAIDWRRLPQMVAAGEVTQEQIDGLRGQVAAFLRTRTKQELMEAAVAYKLAIAPVFTVADLAASPHLTARGFWQAAPEGARPGLRTPGFPATFNGNPLPPVRPAPRLGEHDHEIYVGELGLSEDEFAGLRGRGVIT